MNEKLCWATHPKTPDFDNHKARGRSFHVSKDGKLTFCNMLVTELATETDRWRTTRELCKQCSQKAKVRLTSWWNEEAEYAELVPRGIMEHPTPQNTEEAEKARLIVKDFRENERLLMEKYRDIAADIRKNRRRILTTEKIGLTIEYEKECDKVLEERILAALSDQKARLREAMPNREIEEFKKPHSIEKVGLEDGTQLWFCSMCGDNNLQDNNTDKFKDSQCLSYYLGRITGEKDALEAFDNAASVKQG